MSRKNKTRTPAPCGCLTFYCTETRLLCLHKIFKKVRPVAISKGKDSKGNTQFCLWSEIRNIRTENGTKWTLSSREEIMLALELADKYNVERITI